MRLPELKALARNRGLRNYSRIRKIELVALLRDPAPPLPPQRCIACITLKFDDNGSCRIHRVSNGYEEIVTNKRYVIMPWKMVNVEGKRVSLKEAADEIFGNQYELTPRT